MRLVAEHDKKVILPADSTGLFAGFAFLIEVSMSGADTSGVTDMSSMFEGCRSLFELDISGWDTSSVTNVSGMFEGCTSLSELDLAGWDTSHVEHMRGMFETSFSVDSIRLGDKYKIISSDMFPDPSEPKRKWWSEADQAWYTTEQIVHDRSGRADTYTETSHEGNADEPRPDD